MSRGFSETQNWVFDLDNTLYRADSNLFAQIDVKMGEFIAQYLDVSFERARYLQKNYYRQYGTTLSGLMKVHNMEPTAFLDYVHDIDLAPVPEHPEAVLVGDLLLGGGQPVDRAGGDTGGDPPGGRERAFEVFGQELTGSRGRRDGHGD